MEKNQSQKNQSNPDLYNDVDWPKDADNKTFEARQVTCESGKHTFKPTKKANEVKCDCGVGYIITGFMNLKDDGHIYYENKLVI